MHRTLLFCPAPVLLLASTGVAQPAVPVLDDPKGVNHEVQLLGWSKDERRYALRIYDLDISYEAAMTGEPCKGYVNHLGKPFYGGLSFALYEGTKQLSGWRLQGAAGTECTPPEKAREHLAQAKEALAKEGIDLTALGATLVPPAKGLKPSIQKKGKKEISTTVTRLVVPHGPWAQQVLEVECRVEEEPLKTQDDPKAESSRTSQVTFTLGLRQGKSTTKLGEHRLKKGEWSTGEGLSFTPRLDRLFLSPSGQRAIVLGAFLSEDGQLVLDPRVIVAVVDLPAKP